MTSLPFQSSPSPLPPIPPDLANQDYTHAQARAIRKVWASAWNDGIPGIQNADSYEVKRLVVSPSGSSFVVQIVMGMKNDEGTYASAFCRTTATLIIGPRGTIRRNRPHLRIPGKLVYESCANHLYRVWER